MCPTLDDLPATEGSRRQRGNAVAPVLRYTEDEVQAWLAAKLETEKFLVRRRTKAGGVVMQVAMFAQ